MKENMKFFNYLFVGAVNTAFGYGLYALLVYATRGRYMAAAVLSQIAGVTFSYLTYKFFVFKTKGDYLREYVKCWSVYGAAAALNVAALPACVWILNKISPESLRVFVPYLGGLIVTGITVLFSWFGHKKVTFGAKNQ